MRKTTYILYLLLTFAFVACVNDMDMTPIGEETADVTVPEEDADGVYGNAPTVDCGDAATRSTLTFDYVTKTLLFSWEIGDLVGVFPDKEDNSKSHITYTIYEMISAHRARFKQKDENVNPDIKKGYQFVSYKPAKDNYEGKSTDIPVSFANQYQDYPVNMKSYWDTLKVTTMNKEGYSYKESEKKASCHLPKYDFQVSSGSAPRDNHLIFDYTRLSTFVRLYLKVTEQATYDSIIILNKEANFFIDGKMDISKKDSSAFTPTTTKHYVTLRLGTKTEVDGKPHYAGFKIWNDNGAQEVKDQCPLWSAEKKAGYIVAYMAFAPIQLKNLTNGCTLYLLGHDDSGNKKYYRATNPLSKFNLEQNKIQQWAPSGHSVDDPIEVIPVDVEKWKSDMTFDNEGTGTEDW